MQPNYQGTCQENTINVEVSDVGVYQTLLCLKDLLSNACHNGIRAWSGPVWVCEIWIASGLLVI